MAERKPLGPAMNPLDALRIAREEAAVSAQRSMADVARAIYDVADDVADAGAALAITPSDSRPDPRPDPLLALLPRDDGTMQLGGFVLTPVGLIVPDQPSPDDWMTLGHILKRIEGSLQWLIGDWCVAGERIYGVTYEQIAAEFGYEKQTLWTYAWVARQVKRSIRIDQLSFSHHRLVAALEAEADQRAWLEKAAAEGWSLVKLRRELFPPATDTPADVRLARERAQRLDRYFAGKAPKMSPQEAIDECDQQLKFWADRRKIAELHKQNGAASKTAGRRR